MCSSKAFAATSDPYTYNQPLAGAFHGFVLAGCRVGIDSIMATDYVGAASYERLDGNYTLYVEWLIDSFRASFPFVERFDPPVPITNFLYWYDDGSGFEVVAIESPTDDVMYTACAAGQGVEEPALGSHPLTASGKIRLKDIHGGVGAKTFVHLQKCGAHQAEQCAFNYNIFVGWGRPKTQRDDLLDSNVDVTPGIFWNRRINYTYGSGTYLGYAPMKTVEWVSADASWTSPRAVDAGDLSAMAAELGRAVRWGFDSGEPCPPPLTAPCPNFHVNFAPFGGSANYIDGADITAWAYDQGEVCGLSKVSDRGELAAILDWFGIGATGGTTAFGPHGEVGPEYRVLDAAKLQRAITDPYGYRSNLASTSVPWSQVKVLYR
jgi:hypothetical protein